MGQPRLPVAVEHDRARYSSLPSSRGPTATGARRTLEVGRPEIDKLFAEIASLRVLDPDREDQQCDRDANTRR